MSYSIMYNKQFIKVDNEHVIPFLEVGCNNLYETDNKRRVRDWQNSLAETKTIIASNEDLLTGIDRLRLSEIERNVDKSESEIDNHFGWYLGLSIGGKSTNKTTFADYKNFYKNGIYNAMTIEQLLENGVTISITVPYKSQIITMGFEILPDVTFTSTEHMIETIKKYEDYYKNSISFYLEECGMSCFIDKLKRRKRLIKISKKKEYIEVNEYYGLFDGFGRWFVKYTKNGYKYFPYTCDIIKGFVTEKQAIAYKKKMRTNEFHVVKINEKRKFLK